MHKSILAYAKPHFSFTKVLMEKLVQARPNVINAHKDRKVHIPSLSTKTKSLSITVWIL